MINYTNIEVLLSFLLLFKFSECVEPEKIDPLVNTNAGLIRGLKASDGEYAMFLGIPYATVDETNPFGPSIPHPDFNETFDAFKEADVCPQIEDFNQTVVGSLNCLYLNIYVPNSADSQNLLPVLVWIHGGGFSVGSAGRKIYGPKYIVRHDVILVTLNYRLGPYGFMCLSSSKVPGNQGLKDQLIALRWINRNIQYFGGNSNQVTIFGGSSGAMSVDLHLHFDQENLFQRVIMQSGTALLDDLISGPDDSALLRILHQLGKETNVVDEALAIIATIPPSQIIQATFDAEVVFRVCVENNFWGVENFVPAYTLTRPIPKASKTQILIGINSNEMMSMYDNKPCEYFNNMNIFERKIESIFRFYHGDDDKIFSEFCSTVKHFYIGDDHLSEDKKQAIADFHSDLVFNHPAQRSIERYLKNNAKSVYFFVFSYSGYRNFMKMKSNLNCTGAVHSDELGYLFDISYWKTVNEKDRLILDRMTKMWTNFAKHGNPTPVPSELVKITWKPVNKSGPILYYLNISTEMHIQSRPFKERMAFWDLFTISYWQSLREEVNENYDYYKPVKVKSK